jgi:hypothetical protein
VVVRLHEPLLGNIDAWRAAQSDVPTRAESLRRLAEAGLAATRAKPRKKPPAKAPAKPGGKPAGRRPKV